MVADGGDYAAMIQRMGGPAALAQWKQLERAMRPLQKGAALFPAAAIRWVGGQVGGWRGRLLQTSTPGQLHPSFSPVPESSCAAQLASCGLVHQACETTRAVLVGLMPQLGPIPPLQGAVCPNCCCCRVVCRSDPGIILTAARFFGPQLALTGLVAGQLTVSSRRVMAANCRRSCPFLHAAG